MTGWVPNPAAGDPVMDDLEAGVFEIPTEGTDRGVDWIAVTPGENGELGNPVPSGILYAATEICVEAPTLALARADTVLTLHLGDARQPGDVYAWGNKRVPLRLPAGCSVLVARALGGRGTASVQLWSTADELWFNLVDPTLPDLRAGETDEQWIGVPIGNPTDHSALGATARVVGDDFFEETTTVLPSLAPGAVTNVAFLLRPRFPLAVTDGPVSVRLRIESDSMDWSYEREVAVPVVEQSANARRTFRSRIDGSAQYFAVVFPEAFDPEATYALVLTLHGASVEAIGQANAYSKKDWAFVVAPTNRRPFGFDWEEWGRLDALEVLDLAMQTFPIDPTRVYLTGHSMGGHGTWNVGVHFPGRFAAIGPSAGWSSFYSYTGATRPTGALARARASSDTNVYATNLARRSVYVIHGSADDNVPVREARDMVALVSGISDDVTYHEEPGAGHWWDGEASPGADCVDWPPLFDLFQGRALDPSELEFDFRTPSPFVNPTHSFVTIRSAQDAFADVLVSSAPGAEPGTVEVATTNVRSLVLDGEMLADSGIDDAIVDGVRYEVLGAPIAIGPQDGKRPGVHGPFNEVLQRPWCLVWDDDAPAAYREYAAYLVSAWAIIGNGHACAMPASELTDTVRAERNVVWLGASRAEGFDESLPIDWGADSIVVGDDVHTDAALAFVFPGRGAEGDRLSGAFVATAGSEYLLFRMQPFSSRAGQPDYAVWTRAGAVASGFFDGDWALP